MEARHVRFKALTAVLDLGGYGPETGSHHHLGRFCWSLASLTARWLSRRTQFFWALAKLR